jgi:hypothetical protein
MPGKITAWSISLGLIACCCLWPARAGADVHLAFGTKWQPVRYTTSLYPVGTPGAMGMPGAGTVSPPVVGGLSGFQTTSLDPYFAVFFAQKYGVFLSLDIGYGTLKQEYDSANMQFASINPNNSSFFQFGFALGFKWYITQPRKEKVSPYLLIDFYKYFGVINSKASQELVDATASLLSPIGADFAFGAEYFVTPSFSVGSEVLGLKVANVSFERGSGPTRVSTAYTYLTFYTGISLNYRFQIKATVQATEEEATEEGEEEAAPKKKKKKARPAPGDEEAAPPPPPPPPTPEAVD